MFNRVIVVGGGLSGSSAAHTNSFFGGNSTKATSGINGALTKTQIDSAEIFAQDLSLVSRLEGHSQPRTHRGKEMLPEYGPVILAIGGYATDFTEDPLLKKYRPDIYNLSTTNVNILQATFDDYNDIASNKKKDPIGKKFFHNVPITINDQFYVVLILGGSSLLGCVVYGRVAGDSASRYLFQNLSSATANRLHLEISYDSHKDATSQYTPPKTYAPTRGKKEYIAEEVAKHNIENVRLWVVVKGEGLNVTNFFQIILVLAVKKAILIYAGKDATEEFNMLHSIIGTLKR
ncbi:hypothetical protein C2G38_2115565 [Gigaspora rosea]|uniref:Cytochrome b5 heme-binding domain-containing protein n=1 Tax=Gigaspora rosea TaxID=44941 RepID=A0A397U944_9GLOM|nr:hypothetical protein C2G38_2115565 [Gigaspora rosea]